MSLTKRLALFAGAAMGLGVVGAAQAEPTNKDEVRAIVAEMLADAETRTSLLADGATAGNDGSRFFIASQDGAFRLNVGGDIQIRYLINWRDSDNAAVGNPRGVNGGNDGDDFDPGFQSRLTRVHFDGVIHNDWAYKIQFNFDRTDGVAFLEDAYAQYAFGNGWAFRMGQFKLPLLREELVDNTMQLAAERSLINSMFSQNRSQGVQLAYEDLDWTVALAFSDGLGSQNTDFTDQTLRNNSGFVVFGEADYAFTGRFQYKFAGNWEDFVDFTSRPGQGFAGMLGLAAHYQESPNSGFGGDIDRRTVEYTADVSLEGDGWNLFVAGVGRHDNFRAAGGNNETDDFGVVAQGGYRWSDTELFARWEGFFPDNDRDLSNDLYNFITFGVNQYYHGHAVKATADVVWALEDTSDLARSSNNVIPANGIDVLPNTAIGLLGSSKENEIVLRLQLQLLF